jgi:hypothetical protein
MEKNANTTETTNAPIFIPHNYHTWQTLTSGGSSNTYLQEAARTYVFGPQASSAPSRAAPEQALKENLARLLSADFIKFKTC